MIEINSSKIYACYRILTNDSLDLEFWTIHKKLYDAYVSIYERFLTPDKYSHHILPIKHYETFHGKHAKSELIVFDKDKDYGFKNPSITTADYLSLLDPADFIVDNMKLMDMDPNLIDRLPTRWRNVVKRTKLYQVLNDDSSPCGCSINEDMMNILDVDFDKMFYIAQCVYFSDKSLLELDFW